MNAKKDLNRLAEKILQQLIISGDISQNTQAVFVGVKRKTAIEQFEILVRDLAGSSIPGELKEGLQEALPTLSSERRDALARDPLLISDGELSIWLEFSSASEYLFELGYLFPITADENGPCAVIGTRGHSPQPDYEILLVAQSPSDAEERWAYDWL